MNQGQIPPNAELVKYVLEAIEHHGGTAKNQEIRQYVINTLGLSDEVISEIHSGSRTKLEYQLAWARTIAKQKKLIQSSGRMNWKNYEEPD